MAVAFAPFDVERSAGSNFAADASGERQLTLGL